MSNNKEAVRRWRQRTKERIVESMGGCCQCCGYDRITQALELHHINMDEKEFSFGKIRANPGSWNKIVVELRKCILLCANCHREVHAQVRDIPKDYAKFDETYLDYKNVDIKNPCPVCGKMKPERNKTCSHKCAGSLKGNVDWDSIDLQKEISEKSLSQISKEVGVTRHAVRKRAKKLGLID